MEEKKQVMGYYIHYSGRGKYLPGTKSAFLCQDAVDSTWFLTPPTLTRGLAGVHQVQGLSVAVPHLPSALQLLTFLSLLKGTAAPLTYFSRISNDHLFCYCCV